MIILDAFIMSTNETPRNTHADMWDPEFPIVHFIRAMQCSSMEYIELAIDNLQIAIAELNKDDETVLPELQILQQRLLDVMALHRDCHYGICDPDNNLRDYNHMIHLVGREDTRMVRDDALYVPYGKSTPKIEDINDAEDTNNTQEDDFMPVTTMN